jgi:hypothetical protein
MAVITLTETKLLLGITDTTKDALITALIPMVEADIEEYTNRDWSDAVEPIWPVWMKPHVARMINYLMAVQSPGMKSESQGGYSYTKADDAGGYPGGLLTPFDKVKMVRMGKGSKRGQYRDGRGLNEYWLGKDQLPYGNPNEVIDED